MKCTAIFRILFLIASSTGFSFGASTGDLRVGAAKVDITPPVDRGLYNVWGTHFTSVHDPTYVRAIVAGNGNDTVAIVAIDTSGNNVAAEMLEQIQKTSGIPAQNVVLVSTHDHNTAAISRDAAGGRANRPAAPGANAYVDKVIAAVGSAVSQAKAAMQPALMSVGTGAVDININRDEYQPSGWKLGNNANGPSDKTVWVIRFEKLSGEPIALFVNYAVHSVVLGPDNTAITGDLSGATSRWVEQRYGNKMVALWTSGSAGDQNPKYMSWGMSWGPGYTERTTEPGFPLNDALGMLLGEEVVRVSENMTAKTSKVSLWSAQEDVTCPAKTRPAPANAAAPAGNAPAPSNIDLHLGLVMLNDVALAGVQAEVVTNIYYHLKKESPYANTIMVTHNDGSKGYIPEDAAYGRSTFEVGATRFQQGCAEGQIVKGITGMMERNRQP